MLRTIASASFKRGASVALCRGSGAFGVHASDMPSAVRSFHNTSRRQDQFHEQEPSTTREQQQLIAHHLHHNNPNLLGSLSVRHPSTPFVLGWGDVESELDEPLMADATALLNDAMDIDSLSVVVEEEEETMSMKGRNSRKPTKANHGKRPCCHFARRRKRSRFGNPKRQ